MRDSILFVAPVVGGLAGIALSGPLGLTPAVSVIVTLMVVMPIACVFSAWTRRRAPQRPLRRACSTCLLTHADDLSDLAELPTLVRDEVERAHSSAT